MQARNYVDKAIHGKMHCISHPVGVSGVPKLRFNDLSQACPSSITTLLNAASCFQLPFLNTSCPTSKNIHRAAAVLDQSRLSVL